MTHKILKSMLSTEEQINSFQRLCNAQIEEMRAHDRQMVMVAKDPATYHPYPAPMAHPDIMASITTTGEDYNIDFEIVDDEVKPTLEEKKRKLSAELIALVEARYEQIIPSRKRNLMQIEAARFLQIAENDLSKDQADWLTDYQNKMEATQTLSHYHATMESKIEDLTEDTIEGWKPESLPESLL